MFRFWRLFRRVGLFIALLSMNLGKLALAADCSNFVGTYACALGTLTISLAQPSSSSSEGSSNAPKALRAGASSPDLNFSFTPYFLETEAQKYEIRLGDEFQVEGQSRSYCHRAPHTNAAVLYSAKMDTFFAKINENVFVRPISISENTTLFPVVDQCKQVLQNSPAHGGNLIISIELYNSYVPSGDLPWVEKWIAGEHRYAYLPALESWFHGMDLRADQLKALLAPELKTLAAHSSSPAQRKKLFQNLRGLADTLLRYSKYFSLFQFHPNRASELEELIFSAKTSNEKMQNLAAIFFSNPFPVPGAESSAHTAGEIGSRMRLERREIDLLLQLEFQVSIQPSQLSSLARLMYQKIFFLLGFDIGFFDENFSQVGAIPSIENTTENKNPLIGLFPGGSSADHWPVLQLTSRQLVREMNFGGNRIEWGVMDGSVLEVGGNQDPWNYSPDSVVADYNRESLNMVSEVMLQRTGIFPRQVLLDRQRFVQSPDPSVLSSDQITQPYPFRSIIARNLDYMTEVEMRSTFKEWYHLLRAEGFIYFLRDGTLDDINQQSKLDLRKQYSIARSVGFDCQTLTTESVFGLKCRKFEQLH